MIIIPTRADLCKITNEDLYKDIEYYMNMYDNLIDEITKFGISVDEHDDSAERTKLIKELKNLDIKILNSEKSFVWGDISPSCLDCPTGKGASTFPVSLKCNRDCFFCANKTQPNYYELQDKTNDIIGQFKKTNAFYKKMSSAGLTGGEPLLFPDECEKFLKYVKKINKKTQTRIYTNGDLATEELMERLGKAGLDEIRFGLKPDYNGNVEPEVLKNLETTKKYIPRVMVEMPCKTGQLENMKKLLDKLEKIGVWGINILEFLFPLAHVKEYVNAGFKVCLRPYRILFNYEYAGGALPIAGSELECLELMKYAAEKKFKMGVHYCSLENKLTFQIYRLNHKFKKTPLEHFSKKDFFVRMARAYGQDANKVKKILDDRKRKNYKKSSEFIEFPLEDILILAGSKIQIGISVMVHDKVDGKNCIREVAVHMTDTETFSMSDV